MATASCQAIINNHFKRYPLVYTQGWICLFGTTLPRKPKQGNQGITLVRFLTTTGDFLMSSELKLWTLFLSSWTSASWEKNDNSSTFTYNSMKVLMQVCVFCCSETTTYLICIDRVGGWLTSSKKFVPKESLLRKQGKTIILWRGFAYIVSSDFSP